MKRFLCTTALVMTMSGGAMAQSDTSGFGTVTFEKSDFYASELIGMRIYNSETEMETDAMVAEGAETEWDDIGEINDVILSKDGQVRAVILGVGGFLGMGERDVTVSMDEINVVREEGDSNDRFLVVSTSKEELEQSPEYDRTKMGDEMGDEAEEMEQTAEATANDAEEMADDAVVTTTAAAGEAAENTEEMAENAEAEMTDENDVAAIDSTTDREPLTRPRVEREGYQEADADVLANLTAEDITGTSVYGAADETVGEVDSLIMGEDGKVSEVVINVGGFLGLGEKPVAVTFDELQILRNEEGDDFRIYIDSTEEKLEALPEYQVD